MPRYRKKPVVVEAVQLSWENWNALCEMLEYRPLNAYHVPDGAPISNDCGEDPPFIEMDVPILEGSMIARHGDWIIKGIEDEIYPCKLDIFEETYELVEE